MGLPADRDEHHDKDPSRSLRNTIYLSVVLKRKLMFVIIQFVIAVDSHPKTSFGHFKQAVITINTPQHVSRELNPVPKFTSQPKPVTASLTLLQQPSRWATFADSAHASIQ